jgi:Taurine catabolism dioxygenase TauD, TfdA family
MHSQAVYEDTIWQKLVAGLPSTLDEISAAIRNVLNRAGYFHLTWPMSMEHYEQVAGRLGTIVLRSDVKVDLDRARNQEQVRHIQGRGGIYSPSPLHLHTDPNADLVSWYCVEQDEAGGPMLMLDTDNLEERFSPGELEVLSRVDLWSPSRKSETEPEELTPVPLLSRKNGRYKIFYAPWLLRDSYDDEATSTLRKFVGYINELEEKQLLSLPVKKQDTVFIDNGRMLHGRGALPETSRRHLVRLYLRAA